MNTAISVNLTFLKSVLVKSVCPSFFKQIRPLLDIWLADSAKTFGNIFFTTCSRLLILHDLYCFANKMFFQSRLQDDNASLLSEMERKYLAKLDEEKRAMKLELTQTIAALQKEKLEVAMLFRTISLVMLTCARISDTLKRYNLVKSSIWHI